ncbi:PNMT methyltransferase, partial [Edolisoma coerulescens]|nr:PNMT methyltransferase [Edolisoma coerulescens]
AALREGYEHFDPRAYLRNNYLPPRADFSSEEFVVPWKLRCLAETFASGEGRAAGAPSQASQRGGETEARSTRGTRGQLLSPSLVFPVPRSVEPWQDKERRLRQRLRRILPIDVHRPEPLGAPLRPAADALLSAFCLEAVSPDRAAFVRALAHVGNLLRPGGHALLLGALGESFYLAGPARLPVVPLRESDVREALAAAGFALRELRSYAMPPALRTGVDDVDGVFFAHAQK